MPNATLTSKKDSRKEEGWDGPDRWHRRDPLCFHGGQEVNLGCQETLISSEAILAEQLDNQGNVIGRACQVAQEGCLLFSWGPGNELWGANTQQGSLLSCRAVLSRAVGQSGRHNRTALTSRQNHILQGQWHRAAWHRKMTSTSSHACTFYRDRGIGSWRLTPRGSPGRHQGQSRSMGFTTLNDGAEGGRQRPHPSSCFWPGKAQRMT